MPFAISSYSFFRLGDGPEQRRPPLAEQFAACRRYGVAGIELLGVHIDERAPDDLFRLRRAALREGVSICAVSAHHNVVTPDREERRRQVDIVAEWVDAAVMLGAPLVRVFGGRWGTVERFSAYMAAGGQEPPLPGCTDDDAFAWAIEALGQASYYAGRHGVTLALENHWGLTGTADGVLRILNGVGSPWLGVVLDTGNFKDDPYADLARLAPYAVLVHAKHYHGGGLHYTPRLDQRRVARLLRDADYRGWVSLEYEGKALPDEGIPAALAELRAAWA